jgi:hypothetical protein
LDDVVVVTIGDIALNRREADDREQGSPAGSI